MMQDWADYLDELSGRAKRRISAPLNATKSNRLMVDVLTLYFGPSCLARIFFQVF